MQVQPKKTLVEKYDQAGSIISSGCFATVLLWTATSNAKYAFGNAQWFLGIGAAAATTTDLICFFIFILKAYQLSVLLKKGNDTDSPDPLYNRKLGVLGLSLAGMGIATVGTFFFAANINSQIKLLAPLHLSSIPLPPDWVAPMMFLFALSFLATSCLLDVSKYEAQQIPSDNSHSDQPNEVPYNWGNFWSFIVQIPAIVGLFYQSYAGGFQTSEGLFSTKMLICFLAIGAAGAFSLLLDGAGWRDQLKEELSNLYTNVPYNYSNDNAI